MKIVLIFTTLAASMALAADTSVDRWKTRRTVTNGSRLVASCPESTAYPSGVEPIFHFDASRRTGWTMSGNMATRIPSLVGDRFLTTNESDLVSWKGWSKSTPRLPQGAELVLNADNVGINGPYLDFGTSGTTRGLVFSQDGATGSNGLFKIRTVVAVMDTSLGGGMLLGGGYHYRYTGSNYGDGFTFYRSSSGSAASGHEYAKYFGAYQYCSMGQYGYLLQDGLWGAAPFRAGYEGVWQVAAWAPNDDDAVYAASATGVGLGQTESSRTKPANTGMQRFAELLVFTNRLTEAQLKTVSAHLRKKWFGETLPGCDGTAEAGVLRLSHNALNGAYVGNLTITPPSAEVSVDADQTLTADRISGGRCGGTVTKTGAGTLALRAADTYGGTVKVSAGTLAFAARTIPTALPTRGVVWHLDASDLDSLTLRTEGTANFVVKWTDSENGLFAASAASEASQPQLRYGDFSNGKPCVDFGALNSGCIFDVVNAGGTAATIPSTLSVVYVMSAQEGGGSLFGTLTAANTASYGDAIERVYKGLFNSCLWATEGGVVQVCNGRSICFMGAHYFNGEKDGYAGESSTVGFGYVTPGWQTFGANVAYGQILTLGGTRNGGKIGTTAIASTGGMRLAELLVYDRHLSEEEIRDASAYLAWKWFGRVNAGYAHPNGDTPMTVANVSVGASAKLAVTEGAVRVSSLATNEAAAVVRKTGAGRLEIESAQGGELDVAAGSVRLAMPTDPDSASSAAERAALWLDATAADTLSTEVSGGTNFVKVWGGAYDPRTAAFSVAGYRPFVNDTNLQNGHPMIDFGTYGEKGATIHFARALDNILSLYMVVRIDPAGYAPLLGWSEYDKVFYAAHKSSADFQRCASAKYTYRSLFSGQGYYASVSAVQRYGTIYTNGVQTTAACEPVGDCQLVEIHLTKGAYASAIGYEGGAEWDSSANKPYARLTRGGIRVGELIAYERPLTDREKIATRNYLMKKWFAKTDAQLDPLPEQTAPTAEFSAVNVASGATFEMASGTTLKGDLAYADGAVVTLNLSTNALGVVSAETISVDGTATFGSSLSARISPELPLGVLRGLRVKVLSAKSLVGIENVQTATFSGLYEGRFHLTVRGNDVYLSRVNGGLIISVK